MVPHDGAVAISDLASCFAQSPTEVDIVTRGAKDRVESSNPLEHFLPECHVATGYVLCEHIRVQDSSRAWCPSDHPTGPSLSRWSEIGTPGPAVPPSRKAGDQILEPVGVRIRVVINKGDNLP